MASDVQNRRKQDGSHQVPIVNVSKALRVVPRLRAMFIARHGQALMFCVDRSTSKAQSHARGQQNNRQETRLQTISHASEALMFRSEALRTRYIIRSDGPWPIDVHGSRLGSHIGKALPEQPQTSASRWALLSDPIKASCSPQEKPHASPVDRRVALMDSLIVQIEMAARTNGMSLAGNQPKPDSIQENLNRPGRNNIQTCQRW